MKTAVITGAERGLGLAFAKELKSRGYLVIAAAYATDTVEDFETVRLDVADDKSIFTATQQIAKRTDRIDLLINNAGINYDSPGMDKQTTTTLGKLTREDLSLMFDINASGPILLVQALLPLLKGATVVNVSSYRASFADRDAANNFNNYGYAASKVALNMMTRDLAHDLEPQGARVFAISPGSVRTAMHAKGELEPQVAATMILDTIDTLGSEDSGRFFDNDGKEFQR